MKKVLCGVGAGLLTLKAAMAHAAVDLPATLSVADVETMAGLILAGLAVMWAIRKIIKTTNRS